MISEAVDAGYARGSPFVPIYALRAGQWTLRYQARPSTIDTTRRAVFQLQLPAWVLIGFDVQYQARIHEGWLRDEFNNTLMPSVVWFTVRPKPTDVAV
jgi:hypothetical protein